MFSPRHHLPHYSRLLFKALKTPLLVYIVLVGNIIMLTGSFFFYHAEVNVNPNVKGFGDALWWAMCTITTVGYGDIAPITLAGRLSGVVLMVTGIFFFLLFGSLLATLVYQAVAEPILQVEEETQKEYLEILKRLESLESQIKSLEKKS